MSSIAVELIASIAFASLTRTHCRNHLACLLGGLLKYEQFCSIFSPLRSSMYDYEKMKR